MGTSRSNREGLGVISHLDSTSPCQLEMVLSCKHPEGRILFVGDPYQAIYGFAGADSASIEKIAKRTQAVSLPLSICYRCPKSHIELARAIVPHIQPRPDAIEGIIREVKENELHKHIQQGDLVISRLNSPLVTLGLSLVVKGIPVKFGSDELCNELIKIVYDLIDKKNFVMSQFGKSLNNLQRDRERQSEQKNDRGKQNNLKDKIDMIRQCYFAAEDIETPEDLVKEIEGLFSKSQNGNINLSTIHRAKGLEADRVFIYHPHKLPLTRSGQQDWERKQEQHLHYVALTRAKQELWYIT
jgi:superfamily I DNA/RNA helicase